MFPSSNIIIIYLIVYEILYKGSNLNKYIFPLFLTLTSVDISQSLIASKFNAIIDYCLEMSDLTL